MGVEVVRDITIPSGPRLEGLELTLRLAHVAVEVVEITQVFCLGAGIGVGRVETLVVLDEDEYAVLPRLLEKVEVVVEELGCGLGDENVDLALNGIEGNGVVGRVGSEDGDG